MLQGLPEDGNAVSGGLMIKFFGIFRNGTTGAGAVHRVKTGYYLQNEGHIPDCFSENPNLIEGRGIGDKPVAGNSSITGFKSDNPAKIGWLPYRSAGIASQGNHAKTGLNGH